MVDTSRCRDIGQVMASITAAFQDGRLSFYEAWLQICHEINAERARRPDRVAELFDVRCRALNRLHAAANGVPLRLRLADD